MDFITFIDYIGTFAFAISGIRLASAKRFDWFGAYVVGFVTAVGGGTLRDLLLDVPPFWMRNISYLIVSGFALLFVVCLRNYVIRLKNTFFIFDAIGLGLFTVVGIEKSVAAGYPMWVGIIMGTLTGAFGGMLRDVLINEVPLIFRKDIYAIACVCGGVIYYVSLACDLPASATQTVTAVSVILIRILAVRFGISLPALKGELIPEKPQK
ncbi:MAG: trimeric intracellular cation channel family protein [Alistipes sp.]|nr:trimeric intracellular cation channel family protein [Alistipes sp.]